MIKLFIDKEFIGAIIGPQGKIIQEIQRETGTTINIEEVGNQGEVSVFSQAKEGLDKAVAWIRGIVSVPEEGEVYDAKVKSIMPYGAFVEFLPGKQGLLHISEVSWKRLESLAGVLSEGDTVKVKLIGVDHKTGKFKLSSKVLMAKPEFTREGGGQRPPNEN
jgi:polyribonucleotide nucleotidyltransferase